MKKVLVFVAAGCAVLMAACNTTNSRLDQRRSRNAWIVNSIHDSAIDNAIIAQRTLFPYHFVSGTAALNALGKRDVGVLAAHYERHSGELNIRRGGAEGQLYDARVATVVESLAQAGVTRDRITVSDALPGGEGMPSEQVLILLEAEKTPGQGPASERSSGVATGAGS